MLGHITARSAFAVELLQRNAWVSQIEILRAALPEFDGQGSLYFEFDIPRMGRRIDVVAVIRHCVFVIEFKVGMSEVSAAASDQAYDYALDLRNFHESSHHVALIPVVVLTNRQDNRVPPLVSRHRDRLFEPVCVGSGGLKETIKAGLAAAEGESISPDEWESGRYRPTPSIIEAARALYAGHRVEEIARSDAEASNLADTAAAVGDIVKAARSAGRKSICFITGVPGAGKTLVGLNIATQPMTQGEHGVFLSGNGPLVAVLREALARDLVDRHAHQGSALRIGESRSRVRAFIQPVHHFRDEGVRDQVHPPSDHIVIFDEAQRAWNRERTESFMRQKKRVASFPYSEPEFLISCMDRRQDWAVIVCLVGGGQEINTGEAGISEWVDAVERKFPHWDIHLSPSLYASEYGAGAVVQRVRSRPGTHFDLRLHLAVSMRSFRAEQVSEFVKALLDADVDRSRHLASSLQGRYPVYLCRDLHMAKRWLRFRARGTERFGMVASSQALRLKPHAIDIRSPLDPVHWFLDDSSDVRSSYYLEDVATEFHVQGLELDWVGVVWDGDFRKQTAGWEHCSFVGDSWQRVRKPERQAYLKNAYRVLLTRARQGMVIVVPEGDPEDPTRSPEFYDSTFAYLQSCGIEELAVS